MARIPPGTPRSVPDPYGADYDKMIDQHLRDQEAVQALAAAASTDQPRLRPRPSIGHSDPNHHIPVLDDVRNAVADFQEGDPIGHPGLAESFLPIWGSGREALADFQEGDYLGALANGAMAATDVIPAKAVAGSLEKGAWKFGSHTWGATRKWLGKNYLEAGEHGHHVFIPQNGWGKAVPEWLKNQPWNIKGMPSPQIHGRIHGPYGGAPRFNPVERFWYGTPSWFKAAVGEAVGRPAAGLLGTGLPETGQGQ